MHGIIRCARVRQVAGAEHGIGDSAVLPLQGCQCGLTCVSYIRVASSD